MTSETAPELYCINHPNKSTTLRCNRCNQPICPKCAMLTPTGYRCTSCVREHQKVFNTAQWHDYVLAVILSALLAYIGSRIALWLGWLVVFIAPTGGVITAEAVRWVVRKRRSKLLFQVSAGAVILGGLPNLLIALFFGNLWGALWAIIYIVLITPTVYYRLSGIQIRI